MCSTPPRQPILPREDPDRCWSIIEEHQSFLRVPRKFCNNDNNSSNGQSIRIVCISDTHGKHRSIPIPKCDILIHAGDFSVTGEIGMIQDLNVYFRELKENNTVKEIICIAGNHDMTFHPEKYSQVWKWFHPRTGPLNCVEARESLQDCVYLEDELYTYYTKTTTTTTTTPDNNNAIKIYGSPWSPTFGINWAFNQDRESIRSKWDEIPTDQGTIDILITHGPPLGRGDYCSSKNRAGCLDLLRKVQHEIKPRIHIFGHIHEDFGCTYDGQTLFVNASSVNLQYQPYQPCIVLDLPLSDLSQPAQVVKPVSNLDGEGVVRWLKEKAAEEEHQLYNVLIPFFESKTPLLTGNDILRCVKDYKTLLCELDLHRQQNISELMRAVRKLVMHFRVESF